MLTIAQIKELALHSVKGTTPANFSYESVEAGMTAAWQSLAGSVNQFLKNRYDIYEILIETADEIVPKRVIDALGIFAEVKVVGENERAIFKRKIGKNRAKKFLTQVGLSGVYETFRLDNETFTVNAYSIGGAATIDFDRMVDGAETMTDLMDVLTEGLTDAVFVETQRALRAAFDATSRPDANKHISNGFDAAEMVKLINVCRSYGSGAVIFATPEFVAAMGPDAIVPVSGNIAGVYAPQDIDAIHNMGYINIFRGTPIVQLPNSFIDESNTSTWMDPQLAYILPTGAEKVVKVVLEGATRIDDYKNRDRSMEIHMDKKMGVAIMAHHNWCIYKNTAIPQTYAEVWGY